MMITSKRPRATLVPKRKRTASSNFVVMVIWALVLQMTLHPHTDLVSDAASASDEDRGLSFTEARYEAEIKEQARTEYEWALSAVHEFQPDVLMNKSARGDKNVNPTEITWTVDLNTNEEEVENGVFTDDIHPGLSYVPGSAKLYERQGGSFVELAGYPFTYENNSLLMDFGGSKVNSAYRVEYKTTIVDTASTHFPNRAVFEYDKELAREQSEANATFYVIRGSFLAMEAVRASTDIEHANYQNINWTIKYNYGELALTDVAHRSIIDLFDDDHEIVPGSLQLVPVSLTGLNSGTEGAPLLLNIHYTYDDDISGLAPDYDITDKHGFMLTIIDPTPVTGAYNIKFTTRPVHNYEGAEIGNTAYSGNKMYTATDSEAIDQRFFIKELESADYTTGSRTANWKVTINQDQYALEDAVFKDTLPTGLRLVPESVEWNGAPVAMAPDNITYHLADPANGINGFNIALSDGNDRHVITYTTEFDYDADAYTAASYTNKVELAWKFAGIADTAEKTVQYEASFNPNSRTYNNGYKTGSYDASTQTITWGIWVNYNSKELPNARVVDVLTDPQALDLNSLAITEATINTEGNGIDTGVLLVEETDYAVAFDDNTNTLTIDFINPNPITGPYYITFTTTLHNEVLNDAQMNITAVLSAAGFASTDLNASVMIPNAGEFLEKEGDIDFPNSLEFDWTIVVNKSSSLLQNVTVRDELGDGHLLLKDSFALYNAALDDSNDAVINGEALPATEYKLAIAEDLASFEFTFFNHVNSIYIIKYKSVLDTELLSGSGSFNITNDAEIFGSGPGGGVMIGSISRERSYEIDLSGGASEAVIPKTHLQVQKVDADSGDALRGAEFEVRRAGSGNVVTSGVTNSFGIVLFENLEYGKYRVVEVHSPFGYQPNVTPVEVSLAQPTTKAVTVENDKMLPGQIEIVKRDAANHATLLGGAQFELYRILPDNVTRVFIGTYTTGSTSGSNFGRVTTGYVDVGSYELVEIVPPEEYEILGMGITTVAVNENTVTTAFVDNHRIPKGRLTIIKEDADTATRLEGAEFELYAVGGVVPAAILTTDANGEASVAGLPVGDYELREVAAPVGYRLETAGSIGVSIADLATTTETITNKKLLGDLEIVKTAFSTGELLAGAEFEVYSTLPDGSPDQRLYTVTTAGGNQTDPTYGKVVITGLPEGRYIVLETKAPRGYRIIGPGDYTADVVDEAVTILTVENSRIPNAHIYNPAPEPGSGSEGSEQDAVTPTSPSPLRGDVIDLEALRRTTMEKLQSTDVYNVVSFHDITNHWAKRSIDLLARLNVIEGYPDGSFKADQSITRAEFAVMLVRLFTIKPIENESLSFADVQQHWSYQDIMILAGHGIVNGYNGMFKQDELISREDAAVIIKRLLDVSSLPQHDIQDFSDISVAEPYARTSIEAVRAAGVIYGYPDGSFQPKGQTTRAEVVTMLLRLLKLDDEIAGMIGEIEE